MLEKGVRHASSLALLILMAACTTTYSVPDYREFTTGAIFANKYWSAWSGGKGVQLDGTFRGLDTTVLGGVERLVFYMQVPGGLDDVTVYADREFASQLYSLESGDSITVYGETMVISSSSRMDQGFVETGLAVELHDLVAK